jgi:pimeloyl-ACP methyl ester carboxylesterase
MSAVYPIFLTFLLQQAPVETQFEQVYPNRVKQSMERSAGQWRAVVLIHGLKIHPLHGSLATHPEFHTWQEPGSFLVQALSKDADVFALAYAQTADLDTISQAQGFDQAVQKLHFMGYKEITLVGHSAGGVLARLYVEDHPDGPVTRVVQICAPNLGSSWAKAEVGSRKIQGAFYQSLTKNWRQNVCRLRKDRFIPANVQFLCILGTVGTLGDGLVSCQSQWPEDLQRQGIPVLRLQTTHLAVMHTKKTGLVLAEEIVHDRPRWREIQVEAARENILRKTGVP